MTLDQIQLDRVQGLLYGAAFGDALAAPVEFVRDAARIRAQYPPQGPADIHSGRVTDDTQMMLAGARALRACEPLEPGALEGHLRREFVEWLDDPENNRAPGLTCLRACEGLKAGQPWVQATVPGSKGCGANMRVQPAALIPDPGTRSGVAQLQAAMTHGHPTALATSDLTAEACALLLGGLNPSDLLGALQDHIEAGLERYPEEWLGDLWRQTPQASAGAFAGRGWLECRAALDKVAEAMRGPLAPDTDPCHLTGEGWVAEEALATGLLCFLQHPGDPVRALQRAGTTCGDSDSIACLTGSFAGASLGLSAFPAEWPGRTEYSAELAELASDLAARFIPADRLAPAARLAPEES